MNIEYMRAPHRRNDSPTSAPSPNAALLIDFDNVTMGIRSNLGHELRKLLDSDIIKGKVAVQRAYADWRRYPQYIVPLSESSIDLIFAPAYGSSRKNATDIRLAIDALELVFTRPEIGTFILLSGDSDFSSLVLKLKEYGKYVIGVGLQESASDILVQNCDEYYSYSTLSGMTSAEEMDTAKLDPWELVERSLQRMVDRNDVMRSDRLKQVMLEIDPSFDEKSAGFSKFNRFLAEASHRDLVRLRKGENGQYEVAPGKGSAGPPGGEAVVEAGAGPQEPARAPSGRGSGRGRGSERRRSRGGRGGGGRGRGEPAREPAPSGAYEVDPAEALREAYQRLADVVEQLHDGDEPLRDSMAKRKLLERDSSFDEGALGFRKFSHFLRQAHDEGIVDLIQGEDGNYYLQPAAGEDAHPSRRAEREAPQRDERDGPEPRDHPRGGGTADAEAGRPREPAGTDGAAASGEAPAAEAGSRDEPAEGPDGDEDSGAIAAAKEAARRTLGRFRRGSRGAAPAPEASGASDRPQIGPVDVSGPAESEEGAASAPRDEPEPSRKPEPEPEPEPSREPEPKRTREPEPQATRAEATPGSSDAGGRRGLGRYRRGSRGRPTARARGPAATRGAGAAETSGAASGTTPSGGDGSEGPSSTGVVDHMIRNYSGVGKRTAEALVGEFGDGVFEVIDHEPERLTEVISQRRADAVVAAREAERAGN